MKTVNVNQLVHCGSPFFMGVALHTWTVTGKTIATGRYPLGFVLGRPKQGMVTVEARITEPFAATERLSLLVHAVHQDSTVSTLLHVYLDENSGTGTVDLLAYSGPLPAYGRPLPVVSGDILHLLAVYLPSGAPNAPLVSLLFQVG